MFILQKVITDILLPINQAVYSVLVAYHERSGCHAVQSVTDIVNLVSLEATVRMDLLVVRVLLQLTVIILVVCIVIVVTIQDAQM